MSFPPSFSSSSNAAAFIPPPPGKGKSGLSSPSAGTTAAVAAAVLPTAFRSRPAGGAAGDNATQKNIVDQSLSALLANREMLQTVFKNPTVRNLGKQTVASMVRQQGKEIIGRTTAFGAGGDTANNKQKMAMNSSGVATPSTTKNQMSNSQRSAEKELEDIFGPLSLGPSSNKMPSSSFAGARDQFQWSSASPAAGTTFADAHNQSLPFRPLDSTASFPPHSSASLYPSLDRCSPPSPLIDLAMPSSTNWNVQCRAMALHDFDTGIPGDLKFSANNWITVISRVNDEWLRGELPNNSGAGGIFPVNYVQIGAAELSRLPLENDGSGRRGNDNIMQQQQQQQRGGRQQFLRALYDYESPVAGDLCFRAGELIEVVAERSDSEWAMGKLSGGRSGLVPLTFVERI